jgi:hypothetical protein
VLVLVPVPRPPWSTSIDDKATSRYQWKVTAAGQKRSKRELDAVLTGAGHLHPRKCVFASSRPLTVDSNTKNFGDNLSHSAVIGRLRTFHKDDREMERIADAVRDIVSGTTICASAPSDESNFLAIQRAYHWQRVRRYSFPILQPVSRDMRRRITSLHADGGS